jgi:folylpolyglutamate synthase/dihydropteroate synthase
VARHARFRTFDEAFAWLASRTNYETMATQRYDARTYGLARVERLLAAAGRPDRAFDVAQVLGSKGKGSTAAALAEILRASGRRVGLYTSPHLVDPRERIRVDGRPAPDRLVREALASLVPLVDAAAARGEPLTFFEVHTVAALLAFRAARCDAVVLEAGMGGRLDATTAADAVCKVLTSVSLDHTQHLGRTRAAIAREKASAARRGVPFVCGEPAASAVGRVVAAICRRAGAPLVANGREFRVARVSTSLDRASGRASTRFRLDLHGPGWGSHGAGTCEAVRWTASPHPFRAWGGFADHCRDQARGLTPGGRGVHVRTQAGGLTPFELAVPLLGRHQATNAALAAVTAMTARWTGSPVTVAHVRAGLARTSIRARLETVGTRPLVLVDGAHSPASFSVLARTLRDVAPAPRVFVVGMAADKDVRGSMRRLRGVATFVVATTSGQARAAPPADVARAARAAGLSAKAVPALRAAMAEARRRAGAGGTVVVTGSLYLCGGLLRLWR